MGKFTKISCIDIEKSLENNTRQYFTGNLKRSQEIDFVKDTNVEFGITNYNEESFETPHYHTKTTEYQYVLSGWTAYIDVETGVEYEFKKGDFYAIHTNTVYAQKAKKGTSILFIKTPSINDKCDAKISKELQCWLDTKLKTIRTDYYNKLDSPKVNSIKPAAAVAIINRDNILMLERKDNGKWTMPGGVMEFGEDIKECAVREVKEETGLNIKICDVIDIYSNPNIKIEYSDGEVRQEFTVVYLATVDDEDVTLDHESTNYCWINIKDVSNLKMADSQRFRLVDVIKYLEK